MKQVVFISFRVHLKSKTTFKAPDLCLNIQPQTITALFSKSGKNWVNLLSQTHWPDPLPVECKSRRQIQGSQIRSALFQLISYWKNVPFMDGYGIFAHIDVMPITTIRFHLLAPQPNEAQHVKDILLGNILPAFPDLPKVKDFNRMIGGRLLG